jgi:ribosome recycling factor
VKHVKKVAEEFRVSVRNHRHAALEKLKESEKKKEITEDIHKQGKDRVEKVTKEFIDKVDQVLKAKENEIMEV